MKIKGQEDYREFTINSLEETKQLGEILGKVAEPGWVICLSGDLGAGKTTLTQSIAIGLKIPATEYVTSPTFSIMHEYKGRIPLYHMDFYRLSSVDDIIDLGFEEYFYGNGLVVIEWPERAKEILPRNVIDVCVKIDHDLTRRIVRVHSNLVSEDLITILERTFS